MRAMICHRDQVDRLLDKLKKSLPLPTRLPPDLMASLRRQNPDAKITADCEVAEVFYSGDEGGILCHVRFDKEEEKRRCFSYRSPRVLTEDRSENGGFCDEVVEVVVEVMVDPQ